MFRSTQRYPTLAADLALVVVAFIWGTTFVLVKSALQEIGPFTFLAARFWIAFLALGLPLLGRLWRGERSLWRNGGLLGVVLFAAYAFQTAGLRTTSASKAAFITGLSVVLVPLLAALWLRQLPRPVAWLSALLATVGLALLSMPLGQSLVVGDGLVLGCALMFAIHILLVGRYASRHDPLALSAVQMGVVALLSGAVAPWAESLPARLSPVVWGALLFTALLATVLALVLQISAQRRTPPHRAALLLTLEPVFAALTAYLLGERLTPQGWAGCALILIAMVMAEVVERNG
ncbi:MAG: DMT family transporter [Anaerolineae bacterium]|nr:DMT family transporter [Anaerolineae bacterium]